ncbi:hypothetical protein [Actinomycetospora sp. TBRC 11914]|uniref:hypothetical protein n=1 Tax=Actinomycetospora sp. TBRC 11914 TaxID=2729387 RepID=UPI00145D1AC2|nr:hypothetical protein [Actinomycetospora sp. TBRC 11914]NMO88208.1 hypothetical protein [Actinomycetospora sp. TBRC 11914]
MTTSPEPTDLEGQVNAFADDLTATVRALVPGCDRFEAGVLAADDDGSGRISVRQTPNTGGVPLKVNGEPLLTLTVSMFLLWDAPGAVHRRRRL